MAKPAALRDYTPEPRKRPTARRQIETVHDLQAAVEGVPVADRVSFMGDTYRTADVIGLMPLLRYTHAADKGITGDDMEGLAAIYDMLRDAIHGDEWDRFQRDATDKKAQAEDLITVITQAIEIISARPTRQPSASPDGPSDTSTNSTGSSPSPGSPTGLTG